MINFRPILKQNLVVVSYVTGIVIYVTVLLETGNVI